MKRTIATMGVVGLGLLGATVSANAAPSDKITICHATHSASHPYIAVTMSLSALSGHVADTGDIVPANSGDFMPNGQNLTPENIAILNAGCVVASPPVVSPPVTSPPTEPATTPPTDPVTSPPTDPVTSPPTEPVTTPPTDPVTSPPVEQVGPVTSPVVTPVVPPVSVPEAPVPAAVTPVAAATAPDPAVTNVGYNVQTAVGAKADAAIPGWLAGLTVLFSAVASFVVVRSGVRARKADR